MRKPAYFKSLYVNPRFRRRGYGLELMKFAIDYMQEFLEMDILSGAKSADEMPLVSAIAKSADRLTDSCGWAFCGSITVWETILPLAD